MTINARDFSLQLIGKPDEGRLFFGITRSERRSKVIKREVNVIERIANLMRDRRRKPSDHCAFLGLMKLSLELASAAEFRSHLVEGGGERTHLVESIGRHLNIEVAARNLSRRD